MNVENNSSALAQQPVPLVAKAASADTPEEGRRQTASGDGATPGGVLRAAHPGRPWAPRSREDAPGQEENTHGDANGV